MPASSLKDSPKDARNNNSAAALSPVKLFRHVNELDKRIELLSAQFLGRPYKVAPLGGGPELKELLNTETRSFDCVTYVETVLALSRSPSQAVFPRLLKSIRYHHGRIGWTTRNHYMVDWARRNESEGLIRNATRGRGVVTRERTLNLVPAIPSHKVTIKLFPKEWVISHSKLGRSSDVVMFVSTRRDLDVFHMGFLIRRDRERLLRHAGRTAGGVVDESLEGFLRKNRMSGVIFLEPQCQS